MAEFIFTAQYDGTRTSWDNGVVTKTAAVDNVSERIFANDEAAAREQVARIVALYTNAGRSLRNERLTAAEPVEQAEEVAQPVVAPVAVARPMLRCRVCGTVAPAGGYPFSTLPGSGRCDDCL